MKLYDPDIGPFWRIANRLMMVGSVLFYALLFLGCGKLMAPG